MLSLDVIEGVSPRVHPSQLSLEEREKRKRENLERKAREGRGNDSDDSLFSPLTSYVTAETELKTLITELEVTLISDCRAECSHRRDVGVICSNSSLALYDGLVRLSGERQCEGEVEVFIHQVWRRVLLDSWSLTESSVVCRQLGCGSVLNFYGSSSSSPEHSHECVTGFQCSGSEAHLGNCSSPQTLNCSSTQQLSITCLEFKEIRLTEGCDGNVEVFYNGSWGNVCWNQMDRDTASLICQELNCGRSVEVLSESTARVKSAPNWLDEVTCRPHDLNLWQCPSSPWGQNDCRDDEVAKIICSEEETRESPQSRLTCFTSPSPYQRQCTNLSVSTTPDTTTSASPPVHSTSVSSPQTPPAAPLYVSSELVIVLVVVLLLLLVPLLILIQQNRVMRRALSKRRHRTTTEAVYEEIQRRHNHFTQRGSLISEELHSGYENADELLSAEEFKTAYYDDVTNGSGLKEEMKEIIPGYYDDVITDGLKPDRETEETPESYDDVMTSGQNSDIKKEGVQEEYDDVMSVSEDVRNLLDSSLSLHDGLVRLSGERQCEGEVEVFIHQVWRRVLLDSWSLTESSVVCRQLGCGSVLNFYSSSSSSPEHSHECVTGFQCSGSEAHLGNCSSPQTLNCSSTQQLSITCLEFKEIRLTEGCEGNVEVFYNGSWGNVCYNKMNSDTVSLICQELNCGRSGGEPTYSAGLKSNNWLDELSCRRHDSTLWQCPSSPWGQNDCDNEVAKITCSDLPDLSVSTTPATTTSVSPLVRSTSVSPPQSPPAVSLFVPPELVIVLVVVLLLLLVPLLILIQQNRVMRRALSKRRHRTTTEAVYEEIQHRHNHFTQRGSLISEELHSGYEDADELLSDEMEKKVTPGYDDVITDGLKPDHETVDQPEHYDDVIIIRQTFQGVTDGDQEEYDNVKNSNADERDMLDYDDVGEESNKKKGAI
ncbi:scavenger receptor cysteine-rich type 1 M130-like protein [Labeo rohita]|uniref:Scavenger receptor cysteine-rich type 1 M130-like protein n=1 Tax=Labeo rohita TaxID=84645 RepID=A0A498L1F1_LABRO|nr:scavenger receptor cysteine-rich type 1 M130-like protein [Labeo rohita]